MSIDVSSQAKGIVSSGVYTTCDRVVEGHHIGFFGSAYFDACKILFLSWRSSDGAILMLVEVGNIE